MFSAYRNQRQFSYRISQRGASLLEGIAYLGIAAIVILGAVSLLTNAFGSAQSNRTTEELLSIRTAVRKLYMGQAGYGTASLNGTLVTAHALPSGLSQSGNVITNSFGGGVTVTGATTAFNIVYDALPQDVCINSISGANGWNAISSGSNTISAFPATPDDAAKVCASASSNNVTFTSN